MYGKHRHRDAQRKHSYVQNLLAYATAFFLGYFLNSRTKNAPKHSCSDSQIHATSLRTYSSVRSRRQHNRSALAIPGSLNSIPQDKLLSESERKSVQTSRFDWRAYLDNNVDVRAAYGSEDLALQHYYWLGANERRLSQRVPLVLRYSACGGLMNQHYSHVAAFVLADLLGADVAMPVSLTRDSFSNYFSLNVTRNQVHWYPLPQDRIYDVATIEDSLAARNASLFLVPITAAMPDLSSQPDAFPAWLPPGFSQQQVVKIVIKSNRDPLFDRHSVYLAAQPAMQVVKVIQQQVLEAANALMRTEPLSRPPTIFADLPCNLFSIDLTSLGADRAVAKVAKSLMFSTTLQALADKVVLGIGNSYNGLHLRLEKDASDWADSSGGLAILEKLYWRACVHNGFTLETPLYLASGILSYNDTATMDHVLTNLEKYASRVYYKELFLTPNELKTLSADQKSAVDYLVLLKCERFVGMNSSTYSWWVREFRKLLGYDERTSLFVATPYVGTDNLFNAAARLPTRSRPFTSTLT